MLLRALTFASVLFRYLTEEQGPLQNLDLKANPPLTLCLARVELSLALHHPCLEPLWFFLM